MPAPTLSELEQDALTEIFNIGVGIAAESLCQITGQHVPVSVPVVELTSQRHARLHFVAREQRTLCVIRQDYRGDFDTQALLMFPVEDQSHLVRMMAGQDLPDGELQEVAMDAMGELGNIILNAVISSLAGSLATTLKGALPTVDIMSAHEAFTRHMHEAGAQRDAQGDEQALLALIVDFELGTEGVGSYLAFFLDAHSSQTLMCRLDQFVGGTPPPN